MAKANNTPSPSSAPAVVKQGEKIRAARNARNLARNKAKVIKVPKGTARANRRAAAAKANTSGQAFREVWAKFREMEKLPK